MDFERKYSYDIGQSLDKYQVYKTQTKSLQSFDKISDGCKNEEKDSDDDFALFEAAHNRLEEKYGGLKTPRTSVNPKPITVATNPDKPNFSTPLSNSKTMPNFSTNTTY